MYYVLLAHFQKISLAIIGIIDYPSCTCYFEHTYSLQLRIQLAFFAWKNTRGLSYKWDFARDSSEEKNLSRGRVDARGEGKTRGGEIRKKRKKETRQITGLILARRMRPYFRACEISLYSWMLNLSKVCSHDSTASMFHISMRMAILGPLFYFFLS